MKSAFQSDAAAKMLYELLNIAAFASEVGIQTR